VLGNNFFQSATDLVNQKLREQVVKNYVDQNAVSAGPSSTPPAITSPEFQPVQANSLVLRPDSLGGARAEFEGYKFELDSNDRNKLNITEPHSKSRLGFDLSGLAPNHWVRLIDPDGGPNGRLPVKVRLRHGQLEIELGDVPSNDLPILQQQNTSSWRLAWTPNGSSWAPDSHHPYQHPAYGYEAWISKEFGQWELVPALHVSTAMARHKSSWQSRLQAQKVNLAANQQGIWLIWRPEEIAAPIKIRIFNDIVEGEWLLDSEDSALVEQAVNSQLNHALQGMPIAVNLADHSISAWQDGLTGVLRFYEEAARQNPKVYKPDVVFAAHRLGLMMVARGHFEPARHVFLKEVRVLQEIGVTRGIDFARAHGALGQIYMALGNTAEAEVPLRISAELHSEIARAQPEGKPGAVSALTCLAYFCELTGRTAERDQLLAISSTFHG
jgi:hypothetical protein